MELDEAKKKVSEYLKRCNNSLEWRNMLTFFQKIEVALFKNSINKYRNRYLLSISEVIENQVCWGIICEPNIYQATGDTRYSLPFGVIIAEKYEGNLYHAPTYQGYLDFMDDFLRYKQHGSSKVNWEQLII